MRQSPIEKQIIYLNKKKIFLDKEINKLRLKHILSQSELSQLQDSIEDDIILDETDGNFICNLAIYENRDVLLAIALSKYLEIDSVIIDDNELSIYLDLSKLDKISKINFVGSIIYLLLDNEKDFEFLNKIFKKSSVNDKNKLITALASSKIDMKLLSKEIKALLLFS